MNAAFDAPLAAPTCQLAQFSRRPCEGRLVRCHLIDRQIIRREFESYVRREADRLGKPPGLALHVTQPIIEAAVNNWRTWVWGCGGLHGNGGHHGAFDNWQIDVPREALPPAVEEFAREHELEWWLERRYGPLPAAV